MGSRLLRRRESRLSRGDVVGIDAWPSDAVRSRAPDTEVDVSPRTLLVPALILALGGVAYTQSQPRPTPPPDVIPAPGVPAVPQPTPRADPPAEKSLEQLL